MTFVEIIATFIVIISIIYIYYKYVIFNFWRRRGVFYLPPEVPIGNIKPITKGKKQLGIFFKDIYEKYKNHHRAIGIYMFFKPNLVIADLDLIRIILTKEFKSFHDRGMYCNEKIDPLSGNLFLLPGKKWRHMRMKITPTFTAGKIKQMFSIVKECGEELAIYLKNKAEMRECVEMKEIFARYTTDVIMSTAFGVKSNCIQEPNNEYRLNAKKALRTNVFYLTMFLFVPQVMEFFSIPLTNRDTASFYINMFRKNMKYRQTHNIIRYDFVNLLIQLMEKGYVDPDDDTSSVTDITSAGNKLTLMEAIAQSYIFFLAGFETSAVTAMFATYELAKHQDMQDKVRQEIDEKLAEHGDLSYDVLNEMSYLHKVINETLRKYPPLPFLNRICTEDVDLSTTNIRLPKGTLITIPVLGLHRDPSIYPDPEKFDPERFNADAIAKRHPYAFLPFGEGPRNCIGARFGYVQTKVGLVSLLSKYKFKIHPQSAKPFIFHEKVPGLAVKGGVHLIIEPR